MTSKRIQYRGNCCICGKLQAVQHGRIMNHGYSLKVSGNYHNECHGSSSPYYGSEKAVAFLNEHINGLKVWLKNIPKEIEKTTNPDYLKYLTENLESTPKLIAECEKKVIKWKPARLKKVDLDAEEKKLKQERERVQELAKAEKQLKAAIQLEKRIEREEKARLKWAEILAENRHQIELSGEIVKEWVAEYPDRDSLESDHADRVNTCLDEHGVIDEMKRFSMGAMFISRVRINDDTKGRQIHKF